MIMTELLDESDSSRISAGPATILARVNSVVVDGLIYSLLPLSTKEKIEVRLVQVNDTKTMDFKIAFFFENHHVNNIFPSCKSIVVFDGIIDHVLVNHCYPGLKDLESLTLGCW